MRILTLIGSHRRNGNTSRVAMLLNTALGVVASQRGIDMDAETLYLSDFRIEQCRGCRLCFDRGEGACPLKDDLPEIRKKIAASDGVIYASPVYVSDVSGTMKALIDRLAFICHRPEFFRTGACIVATTGGSPVSHTVRTIQGAHISWGGPLMASAGFKTGALMEPEEISDRYGRQIERLARRFLKKLNTPFYEHPSFLALMMFRIQKYSWRSICARSAGNSVDCKYWEERGWFRKGCTYFVPHRSAFPKVAVAGLVGTVLARLFS